jgi:hypothetical protein
MAIRSEAKGLTSAGVGDPRLRGILAYFLACAAGLVHLNRPLTRRPREELESALLDLATVMPAPWSAFLGRAAGKV